MRWAFLSLTATLVFSGVSCSHHGDQGFNMMANYDAIVDRQADRRSPLPNLLSRSEQAEMESLATLERRQAGRCGPARCSGDLCCSQFGYCGDGDQFCGEIQGCQPEYGRCGDQPAPPVPTTTSTSTRPTSTSRPPVVTTSSSTPPAQSSQPPLPGFVISTSGMCGNTTTCAGSRFGGCCSEYFWCGDAPAFCGTGCQAGFGRCGAAVSSSSTPVAIPTTTTRSTTSSRAPTSTTPAAPAGPSLPAGQRTSTDGSCGGSISCIGSTYGTCCSQFGWCGDGDQFCGSLQGCQAQFGTCGS